MNDETKKTARTEDGMSRRGFVDTSAKTAAGFALAGVTACSSSPKLATERVLGANDTIRIGVIGSGGRGTWGMKTALSHGAKCVAACDVYTPHRERAKEIAEEAGSGGTDTYLDHRELLERDDIDGVYIATPDHWRHDVLLDTLAAGKDVYCEKPLSKSIEEGKSMVKAVRATDRIVQVGNHRRSGEHWARAAWMIKSGELGKVAWVRVYDMRDWSRGDPFLGRDSSGELDWERFQGNAKKRPFDRKRFLAWRWYWDYANGLVTDIGAHQLDVVQWLMDVQGPKSATANGGNYYFDFWETPDVLSNVLDYGTFTANFSVQFINGRQNVGGMICGSEGSLVFDSGKFQLFKRTDDKNTPDIDEYRQPTKEWPRPYEGSMHVLNWMECMRNRNQPNSPIEVGHRVITAAHLCNLAYRTGKRIEWDVEKEQIL